MISIGCWQTALSSNKCWRSEGELRRSGKLSVQAQVATMEALGNKGAGSFILESEEPGDAMSTKTQMVDQQLCKVSPSAKTLFPALHVV